MGGRKPLSSSSIRTKLERAGWQRQFIACEPRLSEAIELYESLGLEVQLIPVAREDIESGCATCYELEPEKYKAIYTRPRK
jgi:hypothetical protein